MLSYRNGCKQDFSMKIFINPTKVRLCSILVVATGNNNVTF